MVRVMGHMSYLGLGVEICVGGVGQVAPCARRNAGFAHWSSRFQMPVPVRRVSCAALRAPSNERPWVAAGPALVTLGNPEKTGRYDVWSSEKIWDLYLYGAINSSI